MHINSLPPSDRDPQLPTLAASEPIRAELTRFRETRQWSNTKIATAIGYSNSVVSQYLDPNGCKYTGDIGAVEIRIREFLRDQRLLLDTGVETIETRVSKRIYDYLEDIRTSRGFGIILAQPGLGKSRALDRYCADHSLAIRFTAWEGECSRACAEDLLFEAADISRTRGKARSKARDLVEKLSGSNRMVIVDDAHYLTGPALSLLCGFRERTGMALALVGITRLLDKLSADPQRLSRVNFQREIKFPRAFGSDDTERRKNIDTIIDHHLEALLGDTNDESQDLKHLCRQIVSHPGHFRSLQQELARAVRLHRGNPAWTWCKCVKEAHHCLIRDYDLN